MTQSRLPRQCSRWRTWRGPPSSAITTSTGRVTMIAIKKRRNLRSQRMNWSPFDRRISAWGACWSKTWNCSRISLNLPASWTIALPMYEAQSFFSVNTCSGFSLWHLLCGYHSVYGYLVLWLLCYHRFNKIILLEHEKFVLAFLPNKFLVHG